MKNPRHSSWRCSVSPTLFQDMSKLILPFRQKEFSSLDLKDHSFNSLTPAAFVQTCSYKSAVTAQHKGEVLSYLPLLQRCSEVLGSPGVGLGAETPCREVDKHRRYWGN